MTQADRQRKRVDYREFPVLYVDDEPENLRIFELGFRREFTIRTASSGDEGLEILSREPISVVLSDQKMPGMTGVEFLGRVRDMAPHTVRLLVTAYGDAETLTSAINDGSIYRYVPKPWSHDDLGLNIRRGIELVALDREREHLMRELGTLNRVALTINQELDIGPLTDLLLETLLDELGYDGAALLLREAHGDAFRIERSLPKGNGVAQAVEGLSIGAGQAPEFFQGVVAGKPQVLTIEQASKATSPLATWVLEVSADQILVVPLMGKSGVVGALAVDNRRGGGALGERDQILMGEFATQASIALDNARLVDDLRRSREQVVRTDRLGTLGTLAAGVAHEINNPLVSIQTFLSLAPQKRSEQDDDFWGEYHQLALGEVDRIRGLVATMSRLARGGSGEQVASTPCDLRLISEEVGRLVAHEASEAEVTLSVESHADTPKILAIREQIHQVLLNLLLNAIQATPRGGSVSVRIWPDSKADGVCVEVADTGRGIGAEHIEQVFDPFFTTKGPDQGTGLGLMICHRIVTDHGGSIEVESEPAQGTRFRVRLPEAGPGL